MEVKLIHIVVLCAFMLENEALEEKTYGVKADRYHPDALSDTVYDVTQAVRAKLKLEPDFFLNHSLQELGVVVSDEVFYDPEKLVLKLDKPRSCHFYDRSPLSIDIKKFSVSLLTTSNELTEYLKTPCQPNCMWDLIPGGTFYKIRSVYGENETSCPDYATRTGIKYTLCPTSYRKNSTNVGLEYSSSFFQCHNEFFSQASDLKFLKFIVLTVEFSPSIKALSYNVYSKTVLKALEDQNSLFLQANHNCVVYIRIIFQNVSSYSKNFHSYVSLYPRTTLTFSSSITFKFVFQSYPKNVNMVPIWDQNGGTISTIMPYYNSRQYQSTTESLYYPANSCRFYQVLNQVGYSFKSVVLHLHKDVHDPVFKNMIRNCDTVYGKNHTLTNLQITYSWKFYDHPDNLLKIIEILNGYLDVTTFYLNFDHLRENKVAQSEEKIEQVLSGFLDQLKHRNILAGCYLQLYRNFEISPDLVDLSIQTHTEYCSRYLKNSTLFLMHFTVQNLESTEYDQIEIILKSFILYRKKLQEMHAGEQISVILKLTHYNFVHSAGPNYPKITRNLYCSPDIERRHVVNEMIINWSQINNVTVITQPLTDAFSEYGWWYDVQTDQKLIRKNTNYPVLIRRNVPETTSNLPKTYSCMNYTKRSEVINFEQNYFAGVYLLLDHSNYGVLFRNPIEIQNVLLLVFAKFGRVNIILKDDSVINLQNIFTLEFKQALSIRQLNVPKFSIYLESDSLELLIEDAESISNQNILSVNTQISGWKKHTLNESKSFKSLLERYLDPQARTSDHVLLGVVIENCIMEANSKFANLRNLSYFQFVNYILCDETFPEPSNENQEQMQTYLDTQLYIKKYVRALLKIDVVFRLNLLMKECNQPSLSSINNYLRFLNDVNQYSKIYKITYFMGSAIMSKPVSSDQNCFWGWWNVTVNSTFAEIQSESLGVPPTRPLNIDRSLPSQSMSQVPWMAIAISTTIFVVAIVVLSLVYRYFYVKQRKHFLSREEVFQFTQTSEEIIHEELVGLDQLHTSTVKTLPFDKRFEISKSHIELGAVIGMGNFGVVYKGILKNSSTVAVKVPKKGCSVESFKTMLAEVKILCYIGTHRNVISFLGSYTKEIKFGLIYVVTEFCSKGSLENFLRRLKPKPPITSPQDTVPGYVSGCEMLETENSMSSTRSSQLDVLQLRRFAYEIAVGMEYITGKKVVHSDLSTRNVLLDHNLTCKICDFGLARKLYSYKYIKRGEEDLPWKWMAPESLKKKEFTTHSDVWSFGITLCEIFNLGDDPYPGITWNPEFCNMLENGLQPSKPEYCTDAE